MVYRGPEETSIPNGQVWNMTYDPQAPSGTVPPVASEQLWQRLETFLKAVVPVVEEAGVTIADHTPHMTCSAPWHAGIAYAIGYMRGLINTLQHDWASDGWLVADGAIQPSG